MPHIGPWLQRGVRAARRAAGVGCRRLAGPLVLNCRVRDRDSDPDRAPALASGAASVAEVATAPVAALLLGAAAGRCGAMPAAPSRPGPTGAAAAALGSPWGGFARAGWNAYHGWRRSRPPGQCGVVPALPAFTPPASHRARVFAARGRAGGLAWVPLDAEGAGQCRTCRSLRLRPTSSCMNSTVAPTRWPPAPAVSSRFLDMAHFGFCARGLAGHAAAAGLASRATPPRSRTTRSTPRHRVCAPAAAGPGQPAFQRARHGRPAADRLQLRRPARAVHGGARQGATRPTVWRLPGLSRVHRPCPSALTPDTCRVSFRLAVAGAAPDEGGAAGCRDADFQSGQAGAGDRQAPRSALPLARRTPKLHHSRPTRPPWPTAAT